ncbi:MAG: 50S ribosomal protein L13 [Coriobacteriia bacterium]
MKTYYAKPGEVEREWLVVDATDIPLGRLASEVASILKGKRKPQYTPHVDTGDFVIVINAEKIKVTGNKLEDKRKYRHSGFPGGLKSISLGEMLAKRPERVIEGAVKGMLPKNTLGRAQGMKLKVYAGPEHPHEAQKPRQITLEV